MTGTEESRRAGGRLERKDGVRRRARESARSGALAWLALLGLTLTGPAAPPLAAQVEVREKPPVFQKADDGEVIPVIVVAEGAKLRRRPSRDAGVESRASFLDAYFLLDAAQDGQETYFLAATMSSGFEAPQKIAGWLHEDDVLIERQALKEESGIFLKGLVVNQWRGVADGLEIAGATLRAGPGFTPSKQPYGKTGEIGLFSFYFIFKRLEASPGKWFFLLGESPILRNVTQPKETLVGWVDARRLEEWSTRQAVQFDKSTLGRRTRSEEEPGAKIFAREAEVIADLRGQRELAGEPLRPVAVEDAQVRRWQHNWPRFPLFAKKPNREISAAGELFHVGFIGDQIYVSGSAGASRERVAENLQRVDQLRQDLKNIDLVFVIDSTSSMRHYFKTAAKAVTEIARRVRERFPHGEGGPDVRYSVVFYRDYVDEDGENDPEDTYLTKRLPLTGNPSAVARFLRDEERMRCDKCGGDEPEAVFWGLEYAINAAASEVAQGVGLRALVLMGDKGNHERDPRGLDTDRVAAAIRDQGYDFFCFHLADRRLLAKDPETRAFSEQCTEISRQVELTSQTEKLISKRPGEVASAIIDAALKVAEELEQTKQAAARVGRGEAGLVDIRRQYGVRLTQRLSKMMQQRGIDPSLFVEASVQVFEKGWVAEKDPLSGARQVETVLLIDRVTLEQLQGLLASLTKNPPSRQDVLSLWTKLLKDLTQGEGDLDRPVAELINSHLGIPVRKKLLAKSVQEIANLSPTELPRLYAELEVDLHRIRGLQAEKQLEVKMKPNGRGGFEIEVKDRGSRRVWWKGKGGREYAWIPIDELP